VKEADPFSVLNAVLLLSPSNIIALLKDGGIMKKLLCFAACLLFVAPNLNAVPLVLEMSSVADLNNIAASADGNVGDNGIAIGISALRNDDSLGQLGGDTIEGFFFTLIGEVGARSKEAQTMADNHRLFTSQIENRRQSVQGVSLNDEAAQLVLFQRAYQAAARTVSIIDDLMEVTINL
ncbi:MAG: hypothetical protein HOH74_14150, partial [Gemmatimonadetes bacterium]|nr:hypothetical protein [Gemmatimonadota bacterium]